MVRGATLHKIYTLENYTCSSQSLPLTFKDKELSGVSATTLITS